MDNAKKIKQFKENMTGCPYFGMMVPGAVVSDRADIDEYRHRFNMCIQCAADFYSQGKTKYFEKRKKNLLRDNWWCSFDLCKALVDTDYCYSALKEERF